MMSDAAGKLLLKEIVRLLQCLADRENEIERLRELVAALEARKHDAFHPEGVENQ